MCYVLKLLRFSPKDMPKMRQFFEFLKILNKKLIIFLSVFIIIIKLLDLTINIRSTAMKRIFFEVCIYKNIEFNRLSL